MDWKILEAVGKCERMATEAVKAVGGSKMDRGTSGGIEEFQWPKRASVFRCGRAICPDRASKDGGELSFRVKNNVGEGVEVLQVDNEGRGKEVFSGGNGQEGKPRIGESRLDAGEEEGLSRGKEEGGCELCTRCHAVGGVR